MSILSSLIPDIIKPIGDIVDNLTTTKEEKMALHNQLNEITKEIQIKSLEVEQQLIAAQSSIVQAETQGQSWLQRNWRPLLMMVIVTIVANNFLISPLIRIFYPLYPLLDLPDKLWDLMMIGVGGYIVSRGAEKVSSNIKGK